MPVSLRSSPSIAGKPSYANRARNRCLRPVYAADFDVNGSADGDVCAIADVSYTNDTPDGLTRLEVVVDDFNGLLHSVAWVLKGMEVRVREAELSTNDEGLATDVFKLTTLQGTPLPDSRAKEVVERVRDFVMYCGTPETSKAVEWRSGNVAVSNKDPNHTVITILELETRIGFLLEVVSVLSGISMKVNSAKVRSCTECSHDSTLMDMLPDDVDIMIGGSVHNMRNSRVMEFMVSEMNGGQLTEQSVQAVLFTLGLVTGSTESTTVPTLRSYVTQYTDA